MLCPAEVMPHALIVSENIIQNKKHIQPTWLMRHIQNFTLLYLYIKYIILNSI